MKRTNTIVMVIIAAAILIAAYAVGLLIRRARTQRETAAMTPQKIAETHAPGGRAARKTPALTRAQMEENLRKEKSMTPEEARKFTEEQVLKRVGGQGSSGGQFRELSAEEREKAPRTPQNLSQEPKMALRSTAGQETEKNDTEPNAAGQE